MNFLERIESDLRDPRKQYGRGSKVATVDARSLEELLHHFRRLDSEARCEAAAQETDSPFHHLHFAVEASFVKSKGDSARVLGCVMDALHPLIDRELRDRPRRQYAIRERHESESSGKIKG